MLNFLFGIDLTLSYQKKTMPWVILTNFSLLPGGDFCSFGRPRDTFLPPFRNFAAPQAQPTTFLVPRVHQPQSPCSRPKYTKYTTHADTHTHTLSLTCIYTHLHTHTHTHTHTVSSLFMNIANGCLKNQNYQANLSRRASHLHG